MKRVVQVNPYTVKVESVNTWPKCKICGCPCHPEDKCPWLKQFDEKFPNKK